LVAFLIADFIRFLTVCGAGFVALGTSSTTDLDTGGGGTSFAGASGAGGVGSPQPSWPRIAFASSLDTSSVASLASNALRFARDINFILDIVVLLQP